MRGDRAWLGLAALWLLASCGSESYPLTVFEGKTYLASRDRTGAEVWFLVDTGSDSSFLVEDWVVRAGGRVEAGPPRAWSGTNLGTSGHRRVTRAPEVAGIPRVLEGLPALSAALPSPLADHRPTVGLLGTDLWWDWSLDFRSDPPRLVHASLTPPADPELLRLSLVEAGSHYGVNATWNLSGTRDPGSFGQCGTVLTVDTGCPVAFALFGTPPGGRFPPRMTPNRAPTLNGMPVEVLTTEGLSLGTFPLGRISVVRVDAGPGLGLLSGTPALVASRAVLDLREWTLTIRRQPEALRLSVLGPETWGWRAHVVPGKGIVVDEAAPGSGLAARGLRAGDPVPRLGGEPADRPRSSLEWRRAWLDFALGR